MSILKLEKKRFIHSLVFPIFFVIILWLIKITETVLNLNLATYGVFPQSKEGLIGILFSPLIHGDFAHLMANSTPLLVLGIGVFYFYNKIAYKVFFLIYFMSGLWVWAGAREAYHIGASGVVYGLASFLFFSGIIRNDFRLLAISLLVVFLYGSMVWGVLPIEPGVSWESHLLGAIAGIVLAIYYRKKGPKKIRYAWQDEEEDEDEKDSDEEINRLFNEYHTNISSDDSNIKIRYKANKQLEELKKKIEEDKKKQNGGI